MTGKAKRKIIVIDEDKCTGCGLCVPDCPEGALRIIDGKARLVREPLCDGLGACLGSCPEGALWIEERDAEPYNERAVIPTIIQQGGEVLLAHLEHLRDHGETEYLQDALDYLAEVNLPIPPGFREKTQNKCKVPACPGAAARHFSPRDQQGPRTQRRLSTLSSWPVQLHLINPRGEHFRNADLLLAADCSAYALGDFHDRFLPGRVLAIACPRLDQNQSSYQEKLQTLIEETGIKSMTVVLMEVPCCRGLQKMAEQAIQTANRKIPLRSIAVGIEGNIIEDSLQ